MTTVTFPIAHGLQGIDRLVAGLNRAGLTAEWHFAPRSQAASPRIAIDFESPQDAERAERSLLDAGMEN